MLFYDHFKHFYSHLCYLHVLEAFNLVVKPPNFPPHCVEFDGFIKWPRPLTSEGVYKKVVCFFYSILLN